MFVAFALSAVCLVAPVNGPITEVYSPVGRYGGHWGVDFAAKPGALVRAPTAGTVTFAGSVAGMNSATIVPLPGVKVSTSYLLDLRVRTGARVERGDVIGLAGAAHGVGGVHLSLRIAGRYVDPVRFLGCRDTNITRALRLVTPPRPYPRNREHRHSRRDLRSDSHRPPARR